MENIKFICKTLTLICWITQGMRLFTSVFYQKLATVIRNIWHYFNWPYWYFNIEKISCPATGTVPHLVHLPYKLVETVYSINIWKLIDCKTQQKQMHNKKYVKFSDFNWKKLFPYVIGNVPTNIGIHVFIISQKFEGDHQKNVYSVDIESFETLSSILKECLLIVTGLRKLIIKDEGEIYAKIVMARLS